MTPHRFSSYEEKTNEEPLVHEPIGRMVQRNRSLMIFMMVICIASLATSGFLALWHTIIMREWRLSNRSLLLEVNGRVEEMQRECGSHRR